MVSPSTTEAAALQSSLLLSVPWGPSHTWGCTKDLFSLTTKVRSAGGGTGDKGAKPHTAI